MLNKVMIIGRLGKAPDVRSGQAGAFGNMNVATDESYTDRDGNRVERTEWHRVALNGKTAENCARFLDKGSLVYVEGRLQTRKWTDQSGAERYTTEIRADRVQFLDRKQDGGNGRPERRDDGNPFNDRQSSQRSMYELDEPPF